MAGQDSIRDLLSLTLAPGLGPTLIGRLIRVYGTAGDVRRLSWAELERIPGIGPKRARAIAAGLRQSDARAEAELALARRLGVRLVPIGDAEYPPLLAQIPDPPPILYVRGRLRPGDLDAYPVAIVGSRAATAYGIEQAERFAGVLARAGLTIVSGGALGVDTAAHRAALRSEGRTIAVLGCGLARCYPPENQALFEQIASGERPGGAVISELPLETPAHRDNFPARNRMLSGLSLGVIVIEAGRGSGSLITARLAAEEHGREVMAVPGRVDSPASAGSNELIKSGGAAMVTEPGDVLALLETPARHAFAGTHAARYADPGRTPSELFTEAAEASGPGMGLTHVQRRILAALGQPMTLDELAGACHMDVAALRVELTLLELQRRVQRQGPRVARL